MKLNKLLMYIKSPKKVKNVLIQKYLYKLNLSDEKHIKIEYKNIFGKDLNLENPQTFNEKLQWLKLNDRKDIYTTMVDKYESKKYVADLIGEEYIIPTLGIYDKFEDINFKDLPNQFVIKCTHDSGGLSICRDKRTFNIKEAKKKIEKSLKINFYRYHREWPYKNVKPRIIVEKYMEDTYNKEEVGLIDYKFYCFNGEPEYLYVSQGLENHLTARITFFDKNFNKAKFRRNDYRAYDGDIKKPINFEKMKELARVLSKNMTFLRVDFYDLWGKIYFSELTFSPCGGLMIFEPNEYDKKLGDLIKLPQKVNKEI